MKEETSKIYLAAIKEHLLKIQTNVASQKGRTEFSHKTVFLINESGAELQVKVDFHKLQDVGDSISEIIKDSSYLNIKKLHLIRIDRGSMIVTLSDSVATKDKIEIKLSYASSGEYIFRYDSKSHRYKILKTEIISF